MKTGFFPRNVFASILFCLMTVIAFEAAYAYVLPVEGDTLLCRHVRFSWPAVPGSGGYDLQVSADDNFDSLVTDLTTNAPGIIVREGFEFGSHYFWRVRPTGEENEPPYLWVINGNFSIVTLPDSLHNAIETTIHDRNSIQPGYTITSSYGSVYGFDVYGNIIWFIPCEESGWFINNWNITLLPSGKFLANHNRGVRILDINDNTIWHTVRYQQLNCHHDAVILPNGNILTIDKRLGMHVEDMDTTYWYYDVLVELNDHAREQWSWSSWDHISQLDYDSASFSRVEPNRTFEWLHSNACHFDPRESVIYYSIRNLSRILKIAYPSGEIIWTMGTPMPSGDVDFGENIDFHGQHAPEIQENGDLLFYDNHWCEIDYSRALIVSIDPDREIPAQIEWEYRHEFSPTQGDADRLDNGNVLITSGSSGSFFEVTEEGELAWEVHTAFPVGTYRGERIKDFFPQAYEFVGPPDSLLVPRWRAEVPFIVYNTGSSQQRYNYSVTSREGWFWTCSGSVEVAPGDSAIFYAVGRIPDDENLADSLIVTVHPQVDPDDVKTWSIIVSPDPATDITPQGGYNDSPGEFDVIAGLGTNGSVNVLMPDAASVDFRIVDLQGRIIRTFTSGLLEQGENVVSLDNLGLPNGCFFVIASCNGRSVARSFTILR